MSWFGRHPKISKEDGKKYLVLKLVRIAYIMQGFIKNLNRVLDAPGLIKSEYNGTNNNIRNPTKG